MTQRRKKGKEKEQVEKKKEKKEKKVCHFGLRGPPFGVCGALCEHEHISGTDHPRIPCFQPAQQALTLHLQDQTLSPCFTHHVQTYHVTHPIQSTKVSKRWYSCYFCSASIEKKV